MTLLEVLLVVALIGLLAGAVALGTGASSGARQRAAATMIMAGVRQGMTRANTVGRPHRLVFDLDAGRVTLEEAQGRAFARDKTDGEEAPSPGDAAEKAAQAEASRVVEGATVARPEFAPVKDFRSSEEPEPGRRLGKGVRFRSVQTEHDPEPRTSGRAYLYFWPRAGTERAAIQLTREGSETGITVLVSALTGRAKLGSGFVDLPEARSDEGYSEREEE
jgi:general secretion pathway protein H